MASPGCTAANAGAFNLTVPTGTNQARQFNAQFDAADRLFVAITGVPLSVIIDLILGGGNPILFLNNSNGNGALTIPTSGNGIIDIAIAAGAGGATNLVFTCTPAAGGGGAAPGTPQAAAEQSETATNATTTSAIVENRTVNGIIDGASKADPKEERFAGTDYVEQNRQRDAAARIRANALYAEKDALSERGRFLFGKITDYRNNSEAYGNDEDPVTFDAFKEGEGKALADLFLGETVRNLDEESSLDDPAWLESAETELKKILVRLREIRIIFEDDDEDLPPRERAPTEDFGLGDGEEILFVGRDPFARALMRYRGFRLDVADTGEGFNDTVKPLSFTRTLSSTIVGWVRAVYTDYEQNDASQQEGDNILVALGAHKDINDDLRVGLFATTTWGDVSSPVNNLDIDTTGYSLGAYGRYKWGEIDVNASTRIGLTDNDIAVSGTTGSYDTRLASFTFGISGQEQLADRVWMRPAISVTNTWVNREDYVNSAGTAIGGNTTWSGNVSAGPTIGTSLTPPSGFKRLEPAIGLQATYTYSDQDLQAGTVAASETDYLSLSVSPQLSMEFENGANLDVFGSYFGIGADLDGWSVGGTLSIPLN